MTNMLMVVAFALLAYSAPVPFSPTSNNSLFEVASISETKPLEPTCAGPYCWETTVIASQVNSGCFAIVTKVWLNNGGSPGAFLGNYVIEANCGSGQITLPGTPPNPFPEGLWGMPEFQAHLDGIITALNKR